MNFQQYQCPFFNNYYYGYRNDVNMQMQFNRAAAYITGGPLAPEIRGTGAKTG